MLSSTRWNSGLAIFQPNVVAAFVCSTIWQPISAAHLAGTAGTAGTTGTAATFVTSRFATAFAHQTCLLTASVVAGGHANLCAEAQG